MAAAAARLIVRLVVATAGLLMLSGCGGNPRVLPETLPSAVPPFPYADILRASKRMGDPMPTSAIWVASRHDSAVTATMGDSVIGNEPVYIAVITGHFVAHDVSTPANSPPPRGTVATFIYDARTGRGTDFGLSRQQHNLNGLGRVHDLRPYLEQAAQGTAPARNGVPADAAAAVETQWLQRLSAGSRLGCHTRFRTIAPTTFRRTLRAAAPAASFAISSVQFLHACQTAPLFVLATSQPRRIVTALPALTNRLDRITVNGRSEWAYEGFFLEVTDESGKPYVIVWNHVRAEIAGGQWATRPDLYPFPHG